MNPTQDLMNKNAIYFFTNECDLDVEGLANFGFDNGNLKDAEGDPNKFYLWALQIKDMWEGRPRRQTLIREI